MIPKKTFSPKKPITLYNSLDSNIKVNLDDVKINRSMNEYYEGSHCNQCHLLMDPGELSPCKYCRGEF